MQDDGADPTDVLLELVLSVACVDAFLSTKASLVNHNKSHGQRPNEAVFEFALPARPTKHTCPTCG